jgi:glycosyltransferase involved in cell wall biosynthesis
MRIAMVSEHASPLGVLGGEDAGGQNVHVAELATEMGRQGVEVVVHTRRDDPLLPPRVAMAPGVVVDHVDAGPPREVPKDRLLPYMDDFAAALHRQWSERRPHVVHAHFWMSGRAALAAARPLGIPVVQTFHALGVVKRRHQGAKDTSPPERVGEEQAIIDGADRLVATCTDEVFELARLGADRSLVRVLPCGVDHHLFGPDGPADARTPGRHRLVAVSRLVERKGLGTIVAALAELPQAELVVAGGPHPSRLGRDREAQRLLGLARRYGVADRLHLRGRVERAEVPALLRSADVAVCVPWYEPFGMVAVEAMACGVPVVASGVGGMVDTVVDGVTGVHVPPRDPLRLAGVLRDLLDDPSLRASLGAAGVNRARDHYSWSKVARATLDTYREVAVPRGATNGADGAGRVFQP